MSQNVLYYPYINIPDTLWTSRALLYWDNVGVIVPQEYIYNPGGLDGHMRDLVRENLVEQIIPYNFTSGVENFSQGFFDVILAPEFEINHRRQNFKKDQHFSIHVEKFGENLMRSLMEMGLAKNGNWPWWTVETETAKVLMTYLATIISVLDRRMPLTDERELTNTTSRKATSDRRKLNLRDQLLADLIPMPTNLSVRDLVKVKEKYGQELVRFRIAVEKMVIDLSRFADSAEFEAAYRLQLAEIEDQKRFIADRMKGPDFGKLVFGVLCTAGSTAISIVQTPRDQLVWTLPAIASAAYTVIEAFKRPDIVDQNAYSYLALLDGEFQ